MNLAIKGHETRGKEVIKILEMLGGKNTTNLQGECNNMIYIINSSYYGEIIYMPHRINGYVILSLEEFLEKFPYKVGDKVYNIIHNENQTITDLAWDSKENEIVYQTNNNEYVFVNYLQPYEDEEEGVYARNEINCYHQDFGDKVRIRLGGDYEIKVEDKVTYIVKKQPQYPKTYKECCEVSKIPKNERYIDVPLVPSDYNRLVSTFTKLLICRDAYWLLAGKQMGLGEPWKSNPSNVEQHRYAIYNYEGTIAKNDFWQTGVNAILSFPTEEMRDAFFENFEDLIEECKELL
jgi:hypothetical protein